MKNLKLEHALLMASASIAVFVITQLYVETPKISLEMTNQAAQVSAVVPVIPSDRTMDWKAGVNVGVPGGIPTNRTKCETAECKALDSVQTSSDLTPYVQAALNSAPSNTYVQIPAGTFTLTSGLKIQSGHSNKTLRGAGMDKTIINLGNNSFAYIYMNDGYMWNYPSTGNQIISGFNKGSSNITLENASEFQVGQLIRIKVENGKNPNVPVLTVGNVENIRGQMGRITAKSGNTLTITPPVVADFPGLTARVYRALWSVDYFGLEGMTINAANYTSGNIIFMEQTFGNWIKDVRFKNAPNRHVHIMDSAHCEIRHSYLDKLNKADTPNGAGLLAESISGCLVEDNIMIEGFPLIEVNAAASGNVFAYNFLNNSSGVIGIDTNHGAHNMFNLYEGNISHNIMADGYFGSVSDDTLYRNWFTGFSLPSTPTYCISLKRFTRNYNIVGNILGYSGSASECDGYGQPNIGNGFSEGTAQPSLGDFWIDLDPVTWSTNIRGTITSTYDVIDWQKETCVNCGATITITSGTLRPDQAPGVQWSGGSMNAIVKTVSGNIAALDSSPWNDVPTPGKKPFPAVGTEVMLWPGAGGFQEMDLDVKASTNLKGNYRTSIGGIKPEESLNGATLPASLFRTSKPAFFGDLAWPPFNPTNPVLSYEAIPAGYRYMKNVEAPGIVTSVENPVTDPLPNISISNVQTYSVINSGGSIAWTTDKPATSQVKYGLTNAYGSQTVKDDNFVTSHTATISGLNPNTTYHYQVVSGDASGSSVSADYTFTTTADPVVVNEAPRVSITSPVGGYVHKTTANIIIQATASDADGISKVEFYDGTTLIGSDTTAPYSYSWAPKIGRRTLSAKAYDIKGASASSAPVSISVKQVKPPKIFNLWASMVVEGWKSIEGK